MDADAAFAVIQRALDDFNTEIGKVRAETAQTEETIASLEYEMEQLRKVIAENALDMPAARAKPEALSDIEIFGENVGSGLRQRFLGRAA